MTILAFLAAWTIRSAVAVLAAAVLLKLFRVKDPSVRLAAWTAALLGSLLIPALTVMLPVMSFPAVSYYQPHGGTRKLETSPIPPAAASPGIAIARQPIGLPSYLLAAYFLGASLLLLRLVAGVLLSRRIIRRSLPTGHRLPGGTPILDSAELAVPAALGVLRSRVVLPRDWREWDAPRLEAILAHEQSHVRRRDPAVQLLSAIHRALLWYSPLSWWMHNRIVRLAEEASDDDALAATNDRVSYAETLLQFMQRGNKIAYWEGVAMARYGKADDRIDRILDGTALSRGLTRFGLAAILLFGAPVVFLAAAAAPFAPQAPAAPKTAHDTARVTQYMIVSGDSSSGSWDSRDEWRYKKWRAKYGSHYAWFRQEGRDYIVTDDHTLDQFEDAMAPQREVDRRQEEVNGHQEEVNRRQEQVNNHQEAVNRVQEDVNRQQNLLNGGNGDQDRVNRLQSEVNAKEQTVNAEQEKVNQQQSVVNKEQDVVNRIETRVSVEVDNALQAVFDSARRQGLAHEVH